MNDIFNVFMQILQKILLVFCTGATLLIVFIAVTGMYKFNYLANLPDHDNDGNKCLEIDLGRSCEEVYKD